MSDETIEVSLPLDNDGFLRRQCSNCGREFKWIHAVAGADDVAEPAQVPERYFCPYCHEPDDPHNWWTDAQRDYMLQLAGSQTAGPRARDLQRNIRQMNRPGSFVKFDLEITGFAEPEPLVEPDDMVRVDFPCHPEEPIKVDEEWPHPLACLVCGIRYPADLVMPLNTQGGSNE